MQETICILNSNLKTMESILKERLLTMSESGLTDQLIETISSRFEEIDANLRERLLIDITNAIDIKYSKFEQVKPEENDIRIAKILHDNFQSISLKVRENLLAKLVAKCKLQFNDSMFMKTVFDILATNFNDIRRDMQKFLLDYSTAYFGLEAYMGDGNSDIFNLDSILADVIAKNYSNLPKELRSRFIYNYTTSNNELIRYIIARSIIKYYDSLPNEVQELLNKLPNDNGALSQLAAEWKRGKSIKPTEGFNKIPIDIQNKILDKISMNKNS